MELEIAPIERSRPVDSQAWCFFFSARPRRKVMTSQSRVILGKSRISDVFVLEISWSLLYQCLTVKKAVWNFCGVFFDMIKFEFDNSFLNTGRLHNL